MFKNVSVIGAGSWGTALAVLLADKDAEVILWSHSDSVAEEIRSTHQNMAYLPGVPIPEKIRITCDLAECSASDLLVFVTPSRAIREVATQLGHLGIRPGAVAVSCTKGIEHNGGKLMTHILDECLPDCRSAVLSGPNHAVEVARKIPAAAVVGSRHTDCLEPLQRIFSFPSFRAYTSDDVTGIQLGGALKNIFAIGAGVSDGFRMGDNAKAALVTRSLAEMMRLGAALGGRSETFFGLSGIGDLMVTCFSRHSRNRTFGERLGSGEAPADILATSKMVVEGYPTTQSARECAMRLGVETPIIHVMYDVLYQGKNPREAMGELLGRPPKPESDSMRRQRSH